MFKSTTEFTSQYYMNNNTELANNYELIKQIGKGSFGEVYLAKDKFDNLYATKVEEKKKKQRLRSEYNIYKKIFGNENVFGIPKIYSYQETTDYNIMVMELLGPSLENVFDTFDRSLTINFIYKLAIDMINIIEQVHSFGFIHRDIKPNNFLFNYQKNSESYKTLYLMDFGLSKKYIQHGKHISFKSDRNLIGTARYASLNIHMGLEPSRRDDLESICYVLIYLQKGKLPWQGLKGNKKISQIEKIGDKKLEVTPESLCDGLNSAFVKFLKYCRDLNFQDKPDYLYIKQLFNADIIKHKIIPSYDS